MENTLTAATFFVDAAEVFYRVDPLGTHPCMHLCADHPTNVSSSCPCLPTQMPYASTKVQFPCTPRLVVSHPLPECSGRSRKFMRRTKRGKPQQKRISWRQTSTPARCGTAARRNSSLVVLTVFLSPCSAAHVHASNRLPWPVGAVHGRGWAVSTVLSAGRSPTITHAAS